jgi:hypothetical protein
MKLRLPMNELDCGAQKFQITSFTLFLCAHRHWILLDVCELILIPAQTSKFGLLFHFPPIIIILIPEKNIIFSLLFTRGQAEKEFKVEVEAIGRVRHKNLVRLLGYCVEGAYRYNALQSVHRFFILFQNSLLKFVFN